MVTDAIITRKVSVHRSANGSKLRSSKGKRRSWNSRAESQSKARSTRCFAATVKYCSLAFPIARRNMATAFCSIRIGAHTTWRWASGSVPSSTALPTKTLTIRSRSFRASARSKCRQTRNAKSWRISTRRCERFAKARPATSDSGKFGRRSKWNMPRTGCCRWKFLRSWTRPISNPS